MIINKNKCVFIYINQGFTLRYLVRSDVFKFLKQSEIHIVIVSHNANEPGFRDTYESNRVSVEQFNHTAYKKYLENNKLQRIFIYLRAFVINGSKGKVDTITVDDYKKYFLADSGLVLNKGFFAGTTGLLFNLVTFILKKNRWLRKLLVYFESKFFRPDVHSSLFKKYSPDLVVVSALCGFKYNELFARECSRFDVPVCAVILSWDNTSGNGYPGYQPDHVIAWTEKMKNELVELNDIDENKITVGGVAHWDPYYKPDFPYDKNNTYRELGLDLNKKTIIYVTKSPKRFPWGASLVSDIARAIENGKINGPAQLLVRIHPLHYQQKEGRCVFQNIINEYYNVADKYSCVVINEPRLTSKQMHFDMDDNETRLLASLLTHSSVMINMFSTMQIESAIFDLPVINMAIKDKCKGDVDNTKQDITIDFRQKHNQGIIQSGGVKTVWTMDELYTAVNNYLENPDLDKEGRMRLRLSEAGPYCGNAGEMIAKQILSVI